MGRSDRVPILEVGDFVYVPAGQFIRSPMRGHEVGEPHVPLHLVPSNDAEEAVWLPPDGMRLVER